MCCAIGTYPIIYLILDGKFGLLNTKTDDLLANNIWNITFYIHIFLGGIALLVGWLQFNKKFREKNIKAHRTIGKIYTVMCLFSGLAASYIATHATGGLGPKIGFQLMAIFWFSTTLFGFLAIKKGNVKLHQELFIYSYAVCFSAVTLRIWLPLLTSIFQDFITAYRIVAWLSWIPNLIIAYFIIQRNRQLTSSLKTI